METQRLHRGRLIDHVQLVVRDIDSSRRFYTAILDLLGIPVERGGDDFFWADELVISSIDSEASQGRPTGPTHLAFQASNRAMVDAAYRAGLEAGGTDNGAPGLRLYHPGYFAAFLLDPDGNNIEIVFHGAAKRSAEAVVVEFEQ